MKQRSSLGVKLATIVFFVLAFLMLLALLGALGSARAYPYILNGYQQ